MSDTLEHLMRDIRACRLCKDEPVGASLPHEPRPVFTVSTQARILIAGQAPGIRVHESGLPFDDRSGDRLRRWLGVDRAQFYNSRNFAIVPMGFCFPGYDAKGSDLPPRRECAPAWHARLMAHMPQLDLVLAIGQYAQAWHLGSLRKKNMTDTVRAWREILDAPRIPRIMPLPHPSWRNTAWLKRHSWFEEELVPVLQQAVQERI